MVAILPHSNSSTIVLTINCCVVNIPNSPFEDGGGTVSEAKASNHSSAREAAQEVTLDHRRAQVNNFYIYVYPHAHTLFFNF
jgi:hypothetical protein